MAKDKTNFFKFRVSKNIMQRLYLEMQSRLNKTQDCAQVQMRTVHKYTRRYTKDLCVIKGKEMHYSCTRSRQQDDGLAA